MDMEYKNETDWANWIGKKIIKRSKKPFKSGKQTGIPLALELNPNSNKIGFKMDDSSIVDCHMCELVNE